MGPDSCRMEEREGTHARLIGAARLGGAFNETGCRRRSDEPRAEGNPQWARHTATRHTLARGLGFDTCLRAVDFACGLATATLHAHGLATRARERSRHVKPGVILVVAPHMDSGSNVSAAGRSAAE